MFCKHCGAEIADEAVICVKCGKPVAEMPGTVSAEACAKAGIINGYPDGTFRPEKTALRSEAAQILYKFHKNFVNK